MSKLNVIHICDKFGMRGSTTHGVSKFFAYLFPRHDHDRYRIKLYALKHPDDASRALEAEGVELTYLGKSASDPTTLTSFLGVIKQEQADVLHLHGWIAANYGRVAGRLAGVPTIMHEHGVDPQFPRRQQIADRMLSGFTHTALAVSKSVQEFLIAHRSVEPGRIRRIYHGVPLEEFSIATPEQISSAREELCIPDGRRVIGTVGRVDVQKGLTYLLQAVAEVLETCPDAHFVIVGDGPKKEELELEAKSLGIARNVTFTGHRSDVQVMQTIFDIQAFPSLWEGTPLTIFEALAMGKAIVSTNVDGLGEVLRDSENALVVEPANPAELASGIIRLLNDRELAERLAAGARADSGNFDIRRTAKNLESLYDELCARG